MPQIKGYDAGALKLQPTEIGVEATAAAGRRQGAFFNQLGAGQQELGRDLGSLGRETGQLGREVGQFSREVGHETSQLGTARARAMNSFGEGIGSGIKAAGEAAVAWQTHREVSAGAKAFADFGLAKNREWQDVEKNADPNDPGVAPKFMAGLEGDLQKLKQGFITDHGQAWAEAHIDSLRKQFSNTTQAGMSALAAKAFTDNYRGTMNSLSATVYNNPELLRDKIGELESGVTALVATSPNVRGVDAVKMHGDAMQKGVESLVKSAALGHINKTGEMPDWLNTDEFSKYVNASELQSFARTAQATNRRMEADARSADRNQKLLDQQKGLDAADKLKARWQNEDGSLNLPKDFRKQVWDDPEIRKYPKAGHELIRQYNEIEKGEKDEKLNAISERTMRELNKGITSGKIINGDPISDAFNDGKLTRPHHDWLQKQVQDYRTPEGLALGKDRETFLKRFAPLIDGDYHFQEQQHSTLGAQQMQRFEMDARRKEAELRANGKNPHDLYDPNSPSFWGNENNIAKYRVSLQEAQKYEKDMRSMDKTRETETPAVGARKKFKQGWGVWNGTTWVAE